MPEVKFTTAGPKPRSNTWQSAITVVQEMEPPVIPAGAHAMTIVVAFPPGHPGNPPHRHSGPCFGYVLEGEMVFELESEPARFTVTMLCEPGKPMLTFVDEEELARRKNRRRTEK